MGYFSKIAFSEESGASSRFHWHWQNVRRVMKRALDDFDLKARVRNSWLTKLTNWNSTIIAEFKFYDNQFRTLPKADSWDVELELVSDQKCTSSVIIDHGTQRYFNYLKPKVFDQDDCDEKMDYKKNSSFYIGMTCDYAYLQLTKQAYFWNRHHSSDQSETGLPMIAVGLRGRAWRSKERYFHKQQNPHK